MKISKKLEEISIKVEQLHAYVTDLKLCATSIENKAYAEAMEAAVESIRVLLKAFKR